MMLCFSYRSSFVSGLDLEVGLVMVSVPAITYVLASFAGLEITHQRVCFCLWVCFMSFSLKFVVEKKIKKKKKEKEEEEFSIVVVPATFRQEITDLEAYYVFVCVILGLYVRLLLVYL
ncbi:hypothetical protein TorRG33x02_306030 [Trema orientale]|uniref:Uncharacterized protein n=1 Tax=Trema orientale TaxID=63057 RepID=A0A2P5BWQ3_TREOI|nr:hypothetical protein TorRG33x02_306030 [Trema orientale]